ncbi:hypothetical protein BKP35_00915 [Anaerobacillus arseniciselenatis]|uniref:Intracellular proteinase inhibitor BsuPI domain-containing protein n=1 Tax=Anaerobacillus arseniciselenatis TaxID=85682 RepID=A0A1S2LW58_9BACI|nr:BsuPI-related putative proteinase inhibitor [Anaerobacillus arseniciselenatis]OIJ15585.1 hypothetical protein BKP35_00915 [Anaerobacillus arseniciselenatis]
MKKLWLILLIGMIAAMTISGCGTADEQIDNNVGGNIDTGYETSTDNGEDKDEIANEMLSTTIQLKDGDYIFSLKNNSDKEIELTFSSSQEYEYVINDSEGNHIYTYSMDKMFAMMMKMKTLAPEEEYNINIDVKEVLATLEKGVYTLEIWPVAAETEGLTSTIEIVVD